MSNAIKSQGVLLEVADAGSPTAWTQVGEVNTISDVDGGEAPDIDVTHLQSTSREYLIGLPDGGQITLAGNLVPSDSGQQKMRIARRQQTSREFRVTLTDAAATKLRFLAFVKQFSTGSAVDDKIPFNATLRVTGDVWGWPEQ